jgi:hypothetical protein
MEVLSGGIATLMNAHDAYSVNAPIHEAEGNHEQAQFCRDMAADLQLSIVALKMVQSSEPV